MDTDTVNTISSGYRLGDSTSTGARYLQLATEIANDIRSGRRGAGDRLPSVRVLARLRQVSINTAIAALRHVESIGLIEAREKSGYFVRRVHNPDSPAIKSARPPRAPRDVAVSQMVTMLSSATEDTALVPLGAAVPDASWFPSKALRTAAIKQLRKPSDSMSSYGALAGELALRDALQRRYADIGCDIDSEELLITNGCSEALHLALCAVGRPGGIVVVESPTYFGFLQLIESLGMKALEMPTDPTEGIDVASVEKALTGRASICCLLLVSSFGNPLGSCLSERTKRALVRLCKKHQVPIIEDDIYGDLHFAGNRPVPMKAYDPSGQVILCSSFSKTLSPGARIGWIAAGQWADQVMLTKRVWSNATPPLMQNAIADYLSTRSYERHLTRMRTLCASQVGRFTDAIERYFPDGTAHSQPEGGFVLWVQMPEGTDSDQLFQSARHHHISILPGQAFSTGDQYRNCIRINCARTWNADIEAAIKKLGKLAHTATLP